MELDLLSVLSDRNKYERFSRFIPKHAVSKETYTILSDMKDWFASNEDPQIDWGSFSSWFVLTKHIGYSEEVCDLYRTIFLKLDGYIPSSSFESVINSFIERDYAERIADVALRIAEGDDKRSIEDIPSIISEYYVETDKAAALESKFVTDDLFEIAESMAIGTGLSWRLNELNLACGPLRKGDFVIVSSRPDSGKTTFLASEATFMAGQMEEGSHVLWFNNEEDGKKVKWRIQQAATARTTSAMLDDLARQQADYIAAVGSKDRIKVVDDKRIHIRDVEEILKNKKASLIIFDQLWKVFGFEKESAGEVDRQTRLFSWAREIASLYGPVITVHQADGSASGQLWIEMNQLYGSKTGIQGEADAIITLGRSNDSGYENIRGLYVPKNKMFGTDPALRNGKFEITIQPEIARFKGEY